MTNILNLLGIKDEPKSDIGEKYFYFINEFKINPFSEEYEVVPIYKEGKIIKLNVKKLSLNIDIFNMLMEQRNKHYERKKEEYNKLQRK